MSTQKWAPGPDRRPVAAGPPPPFFLNPLYFKLIRRGTGLRRRVAYKRFRVDGGGWHLLPRPRPTARRTAAVAPRLLHPHCFRVRPRADGISNKVPGEKGCNSWYQAGIPRPMYQHVTLSHPCTRSSTRRPTGPLQRLFFVRYCHSAVAVENGKLGVGGGSAIDGGVHTPARLRAFVQHCWQGGLESRRRPAGRVEGAV